MKQDYIPQFDNQEGDEQIFFDDITGVQLDTEMVLAAQKEELDWLKKSKGIRKEDCRGMLERNWKSTYHTQVESTETRVMRRNQTTDQES